MHSRSAAAPACRLRGCALWRWRAAPRWGRASALSSRSASRQGDSLRWAARLLLGFYIWAWRRKEILGQVASRAAPRRTDFVFNLQTDQTPLIPSYPLSLPWQKILGGAKVGLHRFPASRGALASAASPVDPPLVLWLINV